MKSVSRSIIGVLFFIITSLLSFELAAQSLPQQAGEASARYTVNGTVTNSVTGAPVSRALVQIFTGSAHSTLTDTQGHFQFEDLPESQTQISLHKPGFFSERELNEGQPSQNIVRIGPDTPTISLKLIPENVIFGRPVSDGEPVEGVPVKLISPRIKEGNKRWEQAGYASTDDDGGFRFSNLRPGTYYAVAGPSSGIIRHTNNTRATGYSQLFYPGVLDIASAAPFEVTAGQSVEADFSLKREPVFKVSGTISAPASVKGVNLQFINLQFINSAGDAGSFGYRFDPVSGSFTSNVTQGSYTLRAQAFENGQVEMAELPLTVSSDVASVALALRPPASIPVLVTTEFSDARRTRMGNAGSVPVGLHLISDNQQLVTAEYWATVKGTGNQPTLFFENVQPGKYSMAITDSAPYYIQSAYCGGTDLLRDDLIVSADSHPAPIEIALRDDGATLNVSLQDAQASGTVLLIPDQFPRQMKAVSFSSQLQFSGVAPGQYSVIALDNVEGLQYQNPEVLSPYIRGGTHVTLGPKQTSSVTLQLTHVGK